MEDTIECKCKCETCKNAKSKNLEMSVKVWERIIKTQAHFNNLALTIRKLAVTSSGAIIGIILVSFRFASPENNIESISIILCVISMLLSAILYSLDQRYYRKLLEAAIEKGKSIEEDLRNQIPNINLTQCISDKYKNERKTIDKFLKFYPLLILIPLCILLLILYFPEFLLN